MDWKTVLNKEAAPIFSVSTIITNIVAAIVILTLGYIIGRLFGKFVKETIKALEIKKALKKTGTKIEPEIIGENIAKYIVYFGATIIALNQLGITPVILNILFVSILLVIIIAIFLSLKDFIPNLISGVYIMTTKKIEKGDRIKVNGTRGKVVEIDLIETCLKNNGNKILIPNSSLTKRKIEIQKKLR